MDRVTKCNLQSKTVESRELESDELHNAVRGILKEMDITHIDAVVWTMNLVGVLRAFISDRDLVDEFMSTFGSVDSIAYSVEFTQVFNKKLCEKLSLRSEVKKNQ